MWLRNYVLILETISMAMFYCNLDPAFIGNISKPYAKAKSISIK